MTDIAKMYICEALRVQNGHFITKLTSAASLPTIAISLSHINSSVSLISLGPTFFLLSDHSMVKHSHSYLLISALLSLLKFLTPFHMISVTQS